MPRENKYSRDSFRRQTNLPDAPNDDERLKRSLPEAGESSGSRAFPPEIPGIWDGGDLGVLQSLQMRDATGTSLLRSIDELLEKDRLREKDGFPRKIRVGRMIKPGRSGKDKVVVVPTTVEEKFIHDRIAEGGGQGPVSGGSGDGAVGDVIGEEPVHAPDAPGRRGPGEGEDGIHELESSAYDLGRILTEKFELPNLKDKGKRRSLTRYSYDMTDRNRGVGQIIDKKATLKQILKTNLSLGNIPDHTHIDPSRFIIAPDDKIYRILSKEKDYESQAMIFFLRDYSGSMDGSPTELVVAQHVLIYSWILYQYARQVETRFILHDTSAKIVPDFFTYYNTRVAGGTKVASAYRKVNEIVEEENLAKDYNIYVFHGTDGDDWDTEGFNTVPELQRILSYASRVGVTVIRRADGDMGKSPVEAYLARSQLLETEKKLLRLDVVKEGAEEARLIDGIRHLISE